MPKHPHSGQFNPARQFNVSKWVSIRPIHDAFLSGWWWRVELLGVLMIFAVISVAAIRLARRRVLH
ncbi:MAG TPA: hypothetical protein VKR79_03390 [Gaiellaceae bacterium]|nr:hypothetical protein [Gaiellaceae bacterium]